MLLIWLGYVTIGMEQCPEALPNLSMGGDYIILKVSTVAMSEWPNNFCTLQLIPASLISHIINFQSIPRIYFNLVYNSACYS